MFRKDSHSIVSLYDIKADFADILPKGDAYLKFVEILCWEHHVLFQYALTAKKPSVSMKVEYNGGDYVQVVFSVSDLEKPQKDEYNWYGDNVSQWLYAGCIQWKKGTDNPMEVSSHH